MSRLDICTFKINGYVNGICAVARPKAAEQQREEKQGQGDCYSRKLGCVSNKGGNGRITQSDKDGKSHEYDFPYGLGVSHFM